MERSDGAKKIAATVQDLPGLPQVVFKVMQLIQDPKSTARDLEQALSKDQALAARVLKISNSAYYGVRGEISKLSRAIVILGFNTLRSVVMTGTAETLHRANSSCFKDRILWEHSLAVALAARIIARECRYPAVEEAYMGGLLHDIGKTILDNSVPEDYHRVIELVYNEGQLFIDAENEVFGFDHTEVGALVVERWNLSPQLIEAVLYHHQPMGSEIDPILCAIVSLANSLCVKFGIGPERDPQLSLPDLDAALMLTLDPERLSEIAGTVKDKLEQEKASLCMV